MRLGAATLSRLSASVRRPRYDRDTQSGGILHVGIGAFHRAHQAVYTDDALDAGDSDWAITGVSLRSSDVAAQLNPQQGLYTTTMRSPQGEEIRLIGCVRGVLVARDTPQPVIAQLASPALQIVSFTITEKGYGRAADGSLDPAQAGAGSVWHYLREGLAARRQAGLPGLTLLCCDNLPENGRVLRALLDQALATDPDLARWVREECRCPSTMVDRIVPAPTDTARASLAAHIGLDDAGAIFTEGFTQWIIEDDFAGRRPQWEAGGAQFVADVRPWEMAKLRMLNGAHSFLAYSGLERGHTFVHEAAADPQLQEQVRRLMLQEAAPTLPRFAGFDAAAYADSLLQRFSNAALDHRLLQIAMDGSQKIPQRWLTTLAARGADGQDSPVLLAGLAAWLRHVQGLRHGVDDPQAAFLRDLWAGGPDAVLDGLFAENGYFARFWRPSVAQRAWLRRHIAL